MVVVMGSMYWTLEYTLDILELIEAENVVR